MRYTERHEKGAPRQSRNLAVRGVAQANQTLGALAASQQALLAQSRPLSMVMGMAPITFFGEEGEDIGRFIDECKRCLAHNEVSSTDAVGQMSYFLEGSAREMFCAEVDDRIAAADFAESERKKAEPKSKQGSKVAQEHSKKDDLEELYREQVKELQEVITYLKTGIRERTLEIARLRAQMVTSDSAALKQEDGDGEDFASTSGGLEARIAELEEGNQQAIQKLSVLKKEVQVLSEVFLEKGSGAAGDPKTLAVTGKFTATREAVIDGPPKDPNIRSRTARAFPTFDDFERWLRATFLLEEDIMSRASDYFGRRHQQGETVLEFAMEVLRLSRKSGLTVTEEERTQHFFSGLRTRMKKMVELKWSTGAIPTTPTKWKWSVLLAAVRKLERDIPELSYEVNKLGEMYDYTKPLLGRKQIAQGRSTMVAAVQQAEDEGLPPPYQYGEGSYYGPPTGYSYPNSQESWAAAVTAAPGNMPAVDPTPCQLCGQPGHGARECRERQRSREIQCYNCREFGHVSRNCPQPRRPRQPLSEIQCYRCQGFGHVMRECPQRASQQPQGRGGSRPPSRQQGPSGNTQGSGARGQQQRQQGNGRRM